MKYDSTGDTTKHKNKVFELGLKINDNLIDRYLIHDDSKLSKEEKDIFDEYTPKLKNSTYGSEEYKSFLKNMKVALDHHYKNNRHHPEYHEEGIKDMSLLDLLEMIIDWKSATLRHSDGDILKSIEINQDRFGYSDELKRIFINTIEEMHW